MSIRKVSDLSTLWVMDEHVQNKDGRFVETHGLSNSYFEISYKTGASTPQSAQFQSNKVKYSDLRTAFNADVISGDITFYGNKTFAGNTTFTGTATFNNHAFFNKNISVQGPGVNEFTGLSNIMRGDAVISGRHVDIYADTLCHKSTSGGKEYLHASGGTAELTINTHVNDGYQLSVPNQEPFWDPPEKFKVENGVPSWEEPPNGFHTVNINYLAWMYAKLLYNAYILNNFEVRYLDYLDESLSAYQNKMLITYRGNDNETIWWSKSKFPNAYSALAADYNSGQSSTADGVAFRLARNGRRVCSPDQIPNLNAALAKYGSAWFYVVDTASGHFALPRTKLMFQGIGTGNTVGERIKPALPNIGVDKQIFKGKNTKFDGQTSAKPQYGVPENDGCHLHSGQAKNFSTYNSIPHPKESSGAFTQVKQYYWLFDPTGGDFTGTFGGPNPWNCGTHGHNVSVSGTPVGSISVTLSADTDIDGKDIYKSGTRVVQPGAIPMYIYMTCN